MVCNIVEKEEVGFNEKWCWWKSTSLFFLVLFRTKDVLLINL